MKSFQSDTIIFYKNKIKSVEQSIFNAINIIIDDYKILGKESKKYNAIVETFFERLHHDKDNPYIQQEALMAIFEWAKNNASPSRTPSLFFSIKKVEAFNHLRDEITNELIKLLKQEHSIIQDEISKFELNLKSNHASPVFNENYIKLKKYLSDLETEIRSYGGSILSSPKQVIPEAPLQQPELSLDERENMREKLDKEAKARIKEKKKKMILNKFKMISIKQKA